MKPVRARKRWLLAIGGISLAGASGCSTFIGEIGVSGVGELARPETRAQVRDAFGTADEMRTCPGGRTVELRSIRQQVPWVCRGSMDCVRLYMQSFGLFDVFVIPVMVYKSEQAKLHYAFVYGEDDRVLYRYDVTAAPSDRFLGAAIPLADSLIRQLAEGECLSWGVCLSAFASEVRQRAACVDYPLTPAHEEALHLVQALAAEVDAGRRTPEDALAEVKWCLRDNPHYWSCLRPQRS